MIRIGKVVSTHGIKGEVRILSDFEYKNKVFVVGNKLVIDGVDYEIKSYRPHKNFDMVTLNDYNNINQVLFLLKKDVYFREEDLKLNDSEVLDTELMTYKVINKDGRVGSVSEVFFASPTNKIIRIMLDKEYLIPYNSPMLVNISKDNKEISVDVME